MIAVGLLRERQYCKGLGITFTSLRVMNECIGDDEAKQFFQEELAVSILKVNRQKEKERIKIVGNMKQAHL